MRHMHCQDCHHDMELCPGCPCHNDDGKDDT